MPDLIQYKHEISQLAQTIIEASVEVYEQAGESLPEQRYYTVGPLGTVVHDCDKLAVGFSQAYIGPIGAQGFQAVDCGPDTWTYAFNVELVRSCYPTISGGSKTSKARYPTPEEFNADADIRLTDAFLMGQVASLVSEKLSSNYLCDVSMSPVSGEYASTITNMFFESMTLLGG